MLGFNTLRSLQCAAVESPDPAVIAGVRELPPLVQQALAHALEYLKQFKLEAVLAQSCAFRPFSQANEISLSPNALRYVDCEITPPPLPLR